MLAPWRIDVYRGEMSDKVVTCRADQRGDIISDLEKKGELWRE